MTLSSSNSMKRRLYAALPFITRTGASMDWYIPLSGFGDLLASQRHSAHVQNLLSLLSNNEAVGPQTW